MKKRQMGKKTRGRLEQLEEKEICKTVRRKVREQEQME